MKILCVLKKIILAPFLFVFNFQYLYYNQKGFLRGNKGLSRILFVQNNGGHVRDILRI